MNAIIFDLDGVLVHTDEYHYQAWKLLADRLGIPFDRSVNCRLRGVSRMESLEIVLENYKGAPFTPKEKQALANEKNASYRVLLEQMSPSSVDDEVRSTLLKLRSRGLRLAVGSSSKNTKTILQRTGLEHMFDVVADGTDILRSKPDPEVFLTAAQRLKAEPCDCAVVEDAVSGIQAAKAAGMFAVGIGDAALCPDADRTIERFEELLKIFQ